MANACNISPRYKIINITSTSSGSEMDGSKKNGPLIFYINGCKVVEEKPDPEMNLATYIREKLNLKGTKMGCWQGQCGLCTVMVSRYDRKLEKAKHVSINSCLVPICAIHGCHVTTVEGVGSLSKGLHPVQERLAKGHGSQCGYCTPGFIMAMYTLLRNKPEPTKEEIEVNLQGNMCRCTGYRPILESFYSFSTKETCACGSFACCCGNGKCDPTEKCTRNTNDPPMSDFHNLKPYDPTQEPIFPPELAAEQSYNNQELNFNGPRVSWHRPTSLHHLFQIMKQYPDSNVVGSYVWKSMHERCSSSPSKRVITTAGINELKEIAFTDQGVIIGSALTIEEFWDTMKEACKKYPEEKSKFFKGLVDIIYYLGSPHLRHICSWVGSVASGFPLSDITICLLASGSHLRIKHASGERVVKLENSFFHGNWKVDLKHGEIVAGVIVPVSDHNDEFFVYKQGQRHGPDTAITNAAMRVRFNGTAANVAEIALAFGGVADRPILADATAKELKGKPWHQVLELGTTLLNNEMKQFINRNQEKLEYRAILCLSYFRRFYEAICAKKAGDKMKAEDVVGFEYPAKQSMKATQIFEEIAPGQPAGDPMHRPHMHQSGEKHTTGEAQYTNDIPPYPGELHLACVLSDRAHAKLIKVDPSEALRLPGVVAFIDYKDVPVKGSNKPAAPFIDEWTFSEGEVFFHGNTVAAVVAQDSMTAERAAKLVKIEYQDLPAVVTVEEAIKEQSFFKDEQVNMHKGQPPESVFPSCDFVLEGEMQLCGQEHFYMEPQNCLVIPKDGDELEVFSSSTACGYTQHDVAIALGVPDHKIVVRAKRIGGAFGGKNTNYHRALFPTVIAAAKLKRPVRCMLNRLDDIRMTGKRHPFLFKYKIGFNKDGKIQAMHAVPYINAGYSVDLSGIFNHHCVGAFDSAYNIPHMKVEGILCKTNLPSNTAFRGFGKVEAFMLMEMVLERVARTVNMDPRKVKELNFLKNGDPCLNGNTVKDCNLQRCWDECLQMIKYDQRKQEIEDYNKNHKWKKRGIAITPVMFGQGEKDSLEEQGGVLVLIYRDGSVLISHGGAEMGQGLNTKVLQAACTTLKVPWESVTIQECGTDKVPNGQHTAASLGSDLYCRAVKTACETLNQRLEPYKAANPNAAWNEVILTAFLDRCDLAAQAHCRLSLEGTKFRPYYYIYGASASEIEMDCLTGDHRVIRTDMVMDIGNSINPAVDIGQIEGGYVQGYGWTTMEELKFDHKGVLITNSALSYKIPNVATVPREFNVSLLKNAPLKMNIYSSKAIGEPPFALGYSAYFAIKEAIMAAKGDNSYIDVGSPLTPEKIRILLQDKIAQMVKI